MKSLVFVHGYFGSSPQWTDQKQEFSEYFEVITPDLPGFGLNCHLQSPPTISGFANHVLNELKKSAIDRFHLVGHSMGGMVAQEMVATTTASRSAGTLRYAAKRVVTRSI